MVKLSRATISELQSSVSQSLRDIRLPPRNIWELRSSGLLRSEVWQFLNDISGHPIGTILRVRILESWGCSETSVINFHYSLRNNPEEGSSEPFSASPFLLQISTRFVCQTKFLTCNSVSKATERWRKSHMMMVMIKIIMIKGWVKTLTAWQHHVSRSCFNTLLSYSPCHYL